MFIVRINATSQEPNRIILENKEYSLLSNPLEKYFELHPEDHPIHGEKIFKTNKKGVVPSGEFLDSANFGYSYLYTQYILLTIQKDSVIKQKFVDKD